MTNERGPLWLVVVLSVVGAAVTGAVGAASTHFLGNDPPTVVVVPNEREYTEGATVAPGVDQPTPSTEKTTGSPDLESKADQPDQDSSVSTPTRPTASSAAPDAGTHQLTLIAIEDAQFTSKRTYDSGKILAVVNFTLRISNQSGSPIKVVPHNYESGQLALLLDGGGSLQPAAGGGKFGMQSCSKQNIGDCRLANRDRYVDIGAKEALTVKSSLTGILEPSNSRTLADVSQGTFVMELLIDSGSVADKVERHTIEDIPIDVKSFGG